MSAQPHTASAHLARARLHENADTTEQAQALAHTVASQLRQCLAERGHAVLAVSGGKSPIPFFHALRDMALDWSKVTLMLADERCVPSNHPDSNTAMVQAELRQGAAAAAQWLGFFDDIAPLSPGQDDAALSHLAHTASLRVATAISQVDVLVLGMGEDAHTASIFPGAVGTPQALSSTDWVAGVWPQTAPIAAPHARLTLTQARLSDARHIHLSIAGARKRAVLDAALAQPGPHAPIASVLQHADQRGHGSIDIWQA